MVLLLSVDHQVTPAVAVRFFKTAREERLYRRARVMETRKVPSTTWKSAGVPLSFHGFAFLFRGVAGSKAADTGSASMSSSCTQPTGGGYNQTQGRRNQPRALKTIGAVAGAPAVLNARHTAAPTPEATEGAVVGAASYASPFCTLGSDEHGPRF